MRTHVAVIGLGIAGSSIAAALARRGHRVTAIEQFSLRHERGSSHGDTRIFRQFPFEGPEYAVLAARSLPLWKQWSEDAGEDLLVQCGGIDAGPPGSRLVAQARSLRESNLDPKSWLRDGSAVQRQFPHFKIPPDWEAVFQPTSGYVRPDATLNFLHARAREAGARLLENFPVTIKAMGHGARLYGPGETIDCDKLVVAAGSWVSGLLPELRLQLRIERRVMGWFGLDGARKLPAGELPIFLFDVDGVWYGMPTPDGLLKAGNHTHFSENLDAGKPAGEPNAADEAFLCEGVSRYLSGFETRPMRMKQCIYTLNEDDRFIMDWHPEHWDTLIFSCCSGHGFKYGPLYGEIAAEMLEGRLPQYAEAFVLKR